jgi:hypothetical protein
MQGFGWETLGKETTSESQAKMGEYNKRDLQEMGCGGMDWTKLALDRGKWRALVIAVMNLGVP